MTVPEPSDTDRQIADIRAFNRFYTRVIGVLDEGIMKSPFSLAEARVIHEIGKLDRTTATALAKGLSMDLGQLSRLIGRLADRALIARLPSESDGRVADLVLTAEGDTAAADLNRLSDDAAQDLLAPLGAAQRQDLTSAMRRITDLLSGTAPGAPVLRGPAIGDLGWLVHRQARLYNAEYGWNAEFEALIARIYAEYEEAAETPPKRLWIAEIDGAIAGSIFVLPNAEDPRVAQLRMLYVEPSARGHGLGHRLVGEAVAFSRQAGYASIMLWTQDCLVAARSVYRAAGFRLAREERHFSFGKELNGQFWEQDL